jgi:hypothetical protein
MCDKCLGGIESANTTLFTFSDIGQKCVQNIVYRWVSETNENSVLVLVLFILGFLIQVVNWKSLNLASVDNIDLALRMKF